MSGQHSQQDRGVGHGARDRSGRVLIGRDRDDALAADQTDGGLDADIHVRAGRTQDRAGRFGADRDCDEIRGDRNAGTRLDPPGESAGRPSLAGNSRGS